MSPVVHIEAANSSKVHLALSNVRFSPQKVFDLQLPEVKANALGRGVGSGGSEGGSTA